MSLRLSASFRPLKSLLFVALVGAPLGRAALAQTEVFSFTHSGFGVQVTPGYWFTNGNDRWDRMRLSPTQGNRLRDYQPDATTGARRQAALYPRPSAAVQAIGLSTWGMTGGILFGGEISYYQTPYERADFTETIDGTPANYRLSSRYQGADVMLNFGVMAVRTGQLSIYPMVGIGYMAQATRLRDDRRDRVYPFWSGEKNDENKFLWNANVAWDVAVNFDLLTKRISANEAGGFKVGLRLGYRAMVPTRRWNVNDLSLNRDVSQNPNYQDPVFRQANNLPSPPEGEADVLPRLGMGGPYVRLSLGLGKVVNGRSN